MGDVDHVFGATSIVLLSIVIAATARTWLFQCCNTLSPHSRWYSCQVLLGPVPGNREAES